MNQFGHGVLVDVQPTKFCDTQKTANFGHVSTPAEKCGTCRQNFASDLDTPIK